MDIVRREHIIRHIPLIEIDMRPLTTLCLMTGDGIGKLHLQGVVVTVFFQFLDLICLPGYIAIVFQHGII